MNYLNQTFAKTAKPIIRSALLCALFVTTCLLPRATQAVDVGQINCPLNLPPQASFQVFFNNGYLCSSNGGSYFDVNIVGSGHFLGWCSDGFASIDVSVHPGTVPCYSPGFSFVQFYSATVIDSLRASCPILDPTVPSWVYLPDPHFTPDQCVWNEINYLLNHKKGTNPDAVQAAIWDLISPLDPAALETLPTFSTNAPPNPQAMQDRQDMVTEAKMHSNFIPGPGDIRAAILSVDANVQVVFVEVHCTPPPLNLSCPAASGQVGMSYFSALVASGGVPPYTFSIIAGSLPPGLTLTPSGAITGVPTLAGNFPFTTKVVDSQGGVASTATVNCGIIVTPPPLIVACAGASGKVGVPYNSAIIASGGTPPYRFMLSSGPLPPGLTLNTNTGAITGTPTAAGTYPYTVKVTDSTGGTAQTRSVNCSITITPPAGMLGHGDTATIGFWHNKNGQALINSLNGGPNSKNLANWLASNFPYCYGINAGANNLTGKKNSEVAAYFLTLFNTPNPPKTDAQLLSAALAVYVTKSSLAGNVAASYGFTVSVQGTGAKTYNVGSYGSAIGLTNDTAYTVLQLLQQANLRKKLGLFDKNAFNVIFDGINQMGDII